MWFVMSTDFCIIALVYGGEAILFLTESDIDAVLLTPFFERERGSVYYLVVEGCSGSS